MNPIVMLSSLVGLVGLFAWSATRRLNLLLAVKGKTKPLDLAEEFWSRLRTTVIYALGQKKMPNYRVAGTAHIFIFAGFSVLLLRTLLLWGRGFDASFDFFGLLAQDTLLGDAYSLTKDVFATLVVVGALVFVYYRVVKREKRMSLGIEGLIILGIIITMMLADMLYDGARETLLARALSEPVHFRIWEPIGTGLASWFEPMQLSNATLTVLEHAGFWWHSLFVLIFLNLLPYSKHFHIITSIPNVFLSTQEPVGRLPMVEDLEGKVEREEPVGLARIEHLNWKMALDTYTCTECGRCTDNCPAATTGKVLSPKHLMLSLRDSLYAAEPRLVHNKPITIAKHEVHGNPPPNTYYGVGEEVEIIGNVMTSDVIWGCTTCRACEEQCPVLITFVDKIVSMRRHEVMGKAEFPETLNKPFQAMEVNGNPWNLPAASRAAWADGLDIPRVSDKPDVPYVYWVGCAASYDDRAKRIARATAQLMKMANIEFAIMGQEEKCTGDPARRAGNEYLFQMLAQSNIETLKEHGVDKKTVVTACPHCFNTLLNEYPDLGLKLNVVHHTDFLWKLVSEGTLKPTKNLDQTMAYHDSCYLGRYNDIVDAPRKVLQAIPGVKLTEVPYWNKRKGLCCGAGGAQMWMEEQKSETRVNTKRTLQLIDTGASTIASGCPFCSTMLGDGLKAEEKDKQIAQLDIAEILLSAM